MPLSPDFLNSIVALRFNNELRGTGVLIGMKVNEKDEKGKSLYHLLLCTCKHVIKSNCPPNRVTLNKNNNSTIDFSIDNKLWSYSNDKKVDLAVSFIKPPQNLVPDVNYYFIEEDNLMYDPLKTLYAGDSVFTIGFPMALIGFSQNYPITRGGNVARIDSECLGEKYFLIDSFVFPGNSGGPIFNKPESNHLEKSAPLKRPFLIGLCSSYVSYQEPCVSNHTGKTRIIFDQNSGLSRIVPIKYVKEIYTQKILPQMKEILQNRE